MWKFYVRKRKTVAAMAGVLLAGSAFADGGCSVNLDAATLQSLMQQVLSSNFSFNGHFRGSPDGAGGGPHGPGTHDGTTPPPGGGNQPPPSGGDNQSTGNTQTGDHSGPANPE